MTTKIFCDECGRKIPVKAKIMALSHGSLSFDIELNATSLKDLCPICFLKSLTKAAQAVTQELLSQLSQKEQEQ